MKLPCHAGDRSAATAPGETRDGKATGRPLPPETAQSVMAHGGPAVGADTAARRTGRIALARLISLVLHPLLVSPLGIVLILWLDVGSFWAATGWAALCTGLVVLPALLFLWRKLEQRHYSDADVSVREQRYGFYLFGGTCMAFCTITLLWLRAPRVLLAGFTAALLALLTASVANHCWTKVSIHTGVMVGVAAAAAYYSLPLALLLGALALVLTWARLVTGRHTLTQALAAWLIAVACALTVFGPWV